MALPSFTQGWRPDLGPYVVDLARVVPDALKITHAIIYVQDEQGRSYGLKVDMPLHQQPAVIEALKGWPPDAVYGDRPQPGH